MDNPTQESTGGQHRGATGDPRPIDAENRGQASIRTDFQVLHRCRAQGQAVCRVQRRAHGPAVECAVRLRPRAANSGSLAAVQQFEMDPGLIRHSAHEPVERVDLPHQMALADPADRGIARHLPERFQLVGQQQRPRAHAGGGRGGLTSRVAAADHDDIV